MLTPRGYTLMGFPRWVIAERVIAERVRREDQQVSPREGPVNPYLVLCEEITWRPADSRAAVPSTQYVPPAPTTTASWGPGGLSCCRRG